MADTTTLPPVLKQERVKGRVLGSMNDSFEFDQATESSVRRLSEKGTIYFPKVASDAWNTLTSTLGETGGAAKDLITENIFGLGVSEQASEVASTAWENHPITQAEAVVQQADAKALEDAQKIKTLLTWFEQITTAQSSESHKQDMNESLRITGRVATEEDAQRVSVSVSKRDLLRTSTLHSIARKDEEVQEKVVEEQSDKSLAETRPVVRMDAIMEGGTGGAKANISQTGGGAG